ncbi:MAG: UDP-N-acetylmuramate--L-alanine ligase [Coleofasciculaceae cyanobacterium SM2_1_6]|nr:UDP-N-acetylmuramate--L-alanine ligase [Coleofasciculaceae cyanobacterium SM2_1_6]
MDRLVNFGGQPFHFIGIGGIGMSALAYVLAEHHLPVSGSDLRVTNITQRLQSVGAHIFVDQEPKNLNFFQLDHAGQFEPPLPEPANHSHLISQESLDRPDQANPDQIHDHFTTPSIHPSINKSRLIPQVICSTAINSNNSEYQAALALGYPIFHRSDLLAALMKKYQSIAVAGTHGKTTTSSLIGYLLLEAGLDPTIVVGGEVDAWQGNARVGQGAYLVAEADESDGSLVKLAASIGVITNIELDHPDHYHSLEEVVNTFKIFARQCQTLIACLDCQCITKEMQPTITYSLDPARGADYTVDQVEYKFDGTTARVWERGHLLGTVQIPVLGKHNLSNTLAAIAVARKLNLDWATITKGISKFTGAKRRFELRGEVNKIRFVDDYAHHPSEISATLGSARLRVHHGERVVAIFQPHRYSRTQTFLAEFSRCFTEADLVLVTDIYSAGEANTLGITGEIVTAAIAEHHPHVFYRSTLEGVSQFLQEHLQPGDLALFLGAGNLNSVIPKLIEAYQLAPVRI